MTADHKLSWQARCPECRSTLDGATGVDHDERPKPGDVSLCLYCGTILVFEEDRLRRAQEKDLAEIPETDKKKLDRITRLSAIARQARTRS